MMKQTTQENPNPKPVYVFSYTAANRYTSTRDVPTWTLVSPPAPSPANPPVTTSTEDDDGIPWASIRR